MKKFEILGVSALLGLALTLGVTACSSSDPDYSNVEAPVVQVKNSISGMVTDMSGAAIKGATVTMDDKTATTGTDGTFTFDNVSAGNHSMVATASGKVSKKETLSVGTNDNQVWNVSLSNEGVTLAKKTDGSASAETETETLKGNDAAKIEVAVEAPAEALSDASAEIVITPTYSADEEISTKGISFATRGDDNGAYLIGTNVSCSKSGVKLQKSLTLTYNVDKEMLKDVTAKKYVDGKWSTITLVETNYREGYITITVDEFGTYALFCTAKLTSSDSSEAIKFTQDSWDNLNGSSAITVANATYTYKLGTDVQAQTDKTQAYLVEMLVRTTGSGLQEVTGTQALGVTLPVGTAMSISGKQTVTTHTASVLGKKVSAKQYGAVTLTTKSWSRNHTGGGSK